MAEIASAVASVLVPKIEDAINDAEKGFSYYNKQSSIRDIYNMKDDNGAFELQRRIKTGLYKPTILDTEGKLD
jgi:hypothetical protein